MKGTLFYTNDLSFTIDSREELEEAINKGIECMLMNEEGKPSNIRAIFRVSRDEKPISSGYAYKDTEQYDITINLTSKKKLIKEGIIEESFPSQNQKIVIKTENNWHQKAAQVAYKH